jgi:hypothetical protein
MANMAGESKHKTTISFHSIDYTLLHGQPLCYYVRIECLLVARDAN